MVADMGLQRSRVWSSTGPCGESEI